jgi:hypothetical protein
MAGKLHRMTQGRLSRLATRHTKTIVLRPFGGSYVPL